MTEHKSSRRNRHMNQQNDHSPHLLKRTIPIKGMHCASCELLIAEELESIQGVSTASASLKTNSATITSTEPIDDTAIEGAVRAAGYSESMMSIEKSHSLRGMSGSGKTLQSVS